MGRGGGGLTPNGVAGGAGKGPLYPVYLDYNATTPIDPEVKTAMISAMDAFGNPSSAHVYGQRARSLVETSRKSVASLVGCFPDEVFFTSGGTEANNWAIKGAAEALKSRGNHIIVSAIEHPAVTEVIDFLQSDAGGAYEITVVGVSPEGIVDAQQVAAAVKSTTILISIMLANNEVGSLQPLHEISQLLKGQAIALHTDASQAVGKIKVDWEALEVDLLTIAGHKLYAPKGVGALIVRRETPLQKFMHGAGHERGERGGTEATVLIAGFGKACEIARKQLLVGAAHMEAMRDRLLEQIENEKERLRLTSVKMCVNGPYDRTKRLPNTLSVSFEGLDGARLMGALMKDVACSTGSACHDSASSLVSPVLMAMGVPPSFANCTLRLSTGRETTEEEVDRAAAAIVQAIRQMKSFIRWSSIF